MGKENRIPGTYFGPCRERFDKAGLINRLAPEFIYLVVAWIRRKAKATVRGISI